MIPHVVFLLGDGLKTYFEREGDATAGIDPTDGCPQNLKFKIWPPPRPNLEF